MHGKAEHYSPVYDWSSLTHLLIDLNDLPPTGQHCS